MVTQDRIETFANMFETGVARLRNPDIDLADKQKTAETMRGLANKLATDIKEYLQMQEVSQ